MPESTIAIAGISDGVAYQSELTPGLVRPELLGRVPELAVQRRRAEVEQLDRHVLGDDETRDAGEPCQPATRHLDRDTVDEVELLAELTASRLAQQLGCLALRPVPLTLGLPPCLRRAQLGLRGLLVRSLLSLIGQLLVVLELLVVLALDGLERRFGRLRADCALDDDLEPVARIGLRTLEQTRLHGRCRERSSDGRRSMAGDGARTQGQHEDREHRDDRASPTLAPEGIRAVLAAAVSGTPERTLTYVSRVAACLSSHRSPLSAPGAGRMKSLSRA